MGNACVGWCSWKGCKDCKGCSGFTKCKCCAGFGKSNCCAGFGKSNCCAGFGKCNCCAGFTKSNCCAGFTKCNWCRKCKCAPFSGCRKCKCSCAWCRKCTWCAGFSCAGLACCVACRKALRSCCPSCFPEKTKKAKKDDSKASVTHSESTRSSPVQNKPPHQERIVKEQSRPTSPIENRWQPPPQRTPSPPRRVEEQPKPVVLPTPRSSTSSSPSPPPRRVEEPPVIPMPIIRTPSPPRRVKDEPKPAAIPITTTPSPPPPQRVKEEPIPHVSPVAKPSTSGESSKQDGKEKTKKPHNVRRKAASAGLQGDVLQIKTGHLKEYYNLGQKLGQGQFGITFHCVEKGTGKEYACKSIAKRKLMTKDDVEDVRREIQIMHHLSGHPNIIKIKGAYEDAVAVHVVMELCKGGELFDRIVERGHYSERKAAELSRIIVGVVQSCHSLGVMHRDLKPENFLFVNEMEESPLQTIDFGLSIFFKPGDIFHDVVGSPYYVAPEVLDKNYGPEADVWSAGVIIYILLCGVPPFWAEAEEDIFEEVLNGELDFSDDPWPDISKSAKDLLMKMLVRNPRKRITAPDVLRHPWIYVDGVAPDKPLDSVLRRLNQFSAMNKIKKMALRVIAEKLSVDEIAGLKEMFKMIDTDNSGQITFEEFKAGLKNFGHNLDDTAMRDLMKSADVDNSGTIDYGEFIAATLHLNKVEREDYLFAAFSYFDKDGSGYITPDELQQACQEFGIEDSRLADMIKEVDQNNDGCIDYNEFVAMMQSGNFDLGKKGK